MQHVRGMQLGEHTVEVVPADRAPVRRAASSHATSARRAMLGGRGAPLQGPVAGVECDEARV